MLVIVCGTLLEIGKATRSFFEEKGFEVIQKKVYETENTSTKARYGPRNLASKEEVLNCDFVYEVNGTITGFNREQIIDAVNGRANCLLSVTPDTFEFIKEVKSFYGEYVVVVYTYIDKHSLEELVSSKEDIEEPERISRLNTGKMIREFCSNNICLFDEVVIYSGEQSAFNEENLLSQYNNIIEKAIEKQKILNNKRYVRLPYTGNKDYIFVSYSHKDTQKIYPVLSKLQRLGYRIWYDEGIKKGANWRVFIGEKIAGCKNFLLFLSENSVASGDVIAEINGAINAGKFIVPAKIDNSEFPLGIQMYVTMNQGSDINSNDFIDRITEAFDDSTIEK